MSPPAPDRGDYEGPEWPATAGHAARPLHSAPRSGADVGRDEEAAASQDPEQATEQAPLSGTAQAGFGRQDAVTHPGLIETIAAVQNGHTVQLTVTPAEDGRVRLMVMAFERSETGPKSASAKNGGPTKKQTGGSATALPFQPIVSLDYPAALDCPESGLIRAFTVLAEQEREIAEINRQTEAFEARKRAAEERLKKAKKEAGTATQKATAAERKNTGDQSLFSSPPATEPSASDPEPGGDD
jgi:hypothetical protein